MKKKYAKIFGQLNEETQQHSRRVADICRFVAPYEGMPKELLYEIGYVHDVGKMYIPSRIIRKSEKLTPIEREIVDMHSYYGYRILRDMGVKPEIYMPVLFHHGFMKPRLIDETCTLTTEMMKSIAIVHSADIFDAMLSKRVYHDPYELDEVLPVLREDALSSVKLMNALVDYYGLYRKLENKKIVHI